MTSSSSVCMPSAGFGLGLRSAHYADFLATPQPVDWLEVITDNYLVEGGKPLVMLDRIRRDHPMAMHGVAMSIGAAPAGPDLAYLRQVKALADRIEPLWVSDHLCWIGPGPTQLHDLYPLPYTEEAARHVVAQIRRAQDVLQRRLVIENVSSYMAFAHDAVAEWEFLAHVAEAADCLLLLDVNNVYVSSVNHGFDPLRYLDGLPAGRVQQIHLAGHSHQGDCIIDTHDHPVAEPVWALYAEACRRFGPVAAMIERDDHIPPLPELLDELARARAVAARALNPVVGPVPARGPAAVWRTDAWPRVPMAGPALPELQRQLVAAVLGPHEALAGSAVAPCLRDSGPAQAGRRLGIYHNAYRARLAEVLADTYSKTLSYLGDELFDPLAREHAVRHPPQTRRLGRWGLDFPETLRAHYPHNPELHELAQLDVDLRTCFDGPDVAALDAALVAADPGHGWLHQAAPAHPSLRLRPITTNVVQLWQAIDADQEVPPPHALAEPRVLAVWRKGLQPHFKTLGPGEARLLQHLLAGQSLAEASAVLLDDPVLGDPQAYSELLASWWADGLLRAPGAGPGPVLTS